MTTSTASPTRSSLATPQPFSSGRTCGPAPFAQAVRNADGELIIYERIPYDLVVAAIEVARLTPFGTRGH